MHLKTIYENKNDDANQLLLDYRFTITRSTIVHVQFEKSHMPSNQTLFMVLAINKT